MLDKFTVSGVLETLDNFDFDMDKGVFSKEESAATFLGLA